MFGETLCSDVSSSSTENIFLLTNRGYRQDPQQPSTGTHLNPGRGYMGGRAGAMVGARGFVGGGVQNGQGSGFPSFCYGCHSWGYSYPVSAF